MLSRVRIIHLDIYKILLIVTVLLLTSCKDESLPLKQEPTTVSIKIATKEKIAMKQTLVGRTVAYMSASIRPQIDGIIQARLYQEGEKVEAGQVLYQIDPQVYQANYDNAKAELAKAEASVLSSQPKVSRYLSLAKLDAISQQDRDDAVAELRLNEASVEAAKADLQTALINLNYTKITAPISDHIGTSAYTQGALVTTHQDAALTTINQLDPIYVDVTQTNSQMLALRKLIDNGQLDKTVGNISVSIQLEDGSTYSHLGSLEFVGSDIDTKTGTITLRAIFPNPDYLLLPGAYVIAELSLATNNQAILIPQNAVSRNNRGEATVKLVDDNNKVIERVVKTDQAINNSWLILSGLEAGEKVIIQGGSKVSVGQEVKTELN